MVFIAAELGVNWRDLREAEMMIGLAKDAGADAVKFQVYKPEHVKGHPRQQELEEIVLVPERIKLLKEAADGCGIEFFATPYFPEAVDWLEAAGVKRYKIRYADSYHNTDLIRRVMGCGKPVYVSWDNKTPFTAEAFREYNTVTPGRGNFYPIYCIPKYPPNIKEIKFNEISFICDSENRFGLWYGYSNHYPSIVPPLVAAARGCKYIEVHLKQDKYHGGYKPIDDAASITFSQLAELCRLVREIEKVEW